MTHQYTRIAQFSLIANAAGLAGWISLANADEHSVVVQSDSAPALVAPALSPPANTSDVEPLPPPAKVRAQSDAKQPARVEAKKPFMRPAEPQRVPAMTALSVEQEPMPAPQTDVIIDAPEYEVRPAPPVAYDTDRDARRLYRASGEVPLTMIVCNPADGCYYEIPICIPGCCVGEEPRMDGGRGLLGRGVVEFCWECGFRAIVKFRPVLGDVKVEYEGD
jgi:hypothetical protein